MKTIKVIVGTENGAKLAAVKAVFETVFEDVVIASIAAESGIADQPMTDEESIRGAINRAQHARQSLPDADYAVGLEGNVQRVAGRMFLHGWVAIEDEQGTLSLGHSGGMEVPESISRRLEAGEELGPIIQQVFADVNNEIRHSSGTGGVLTGGLYTRIDEFTDATKCALAKFVSPELYR